jgi:hypothetical protein
MKKLLLLLAFLPLLTMAQGVEYSISGGLCSNTGPVNTVLPANTTETGLLPSYAGSLGLLINLGPWQVGIVAEAYELKTTRDVVTSFPAGDLHAKSTVQYASPQIPILLQINRVFYMPKSNIYLGIAGWSAVNMLKNAAGEMKYHELQPVFGAQLGYTYGISNLIGINVNLAARYNAVPGSPIISFPLTAGIRIRP